ncbi:histidinol-phosphate aminotransferase [Sphingobacterium spiritivorum]|uniref:histidinol-phosphate aminotransferase n=2 Tax=Sphingobacterium spiritivorum TaxID=258 RepID=UPI003DA45BEC
MKADIQHLFILFISGLLLFTSCKQDELIFPDVVQTEETVTTTRPTARPNNLTLFSNYNQQIEIFWPAVSDRVKKATVTYQEASGTKSVDVVSFDKPTVLAVEQEKEYSINIVYYTADNTPSKTSTIKITSKPFENEFKAKGVTMLASPGGVRFIFPSTTAKQFEYKIKYQVDGQPKEKTVTSSELDVIVEVLGLNDETKAYDFDITVTDKVLNLTSKSYPYSQRPGILPYKEIAASLSMSGYFNKGQIFWTNGSGKNVNFEISYLLNGAPQKLTIPNTAVENGNYIFAINTTATAIAVKVTGEEGLSTVVNGSAAPSQLKAFNTADARKGWTPYASNSNSTSEGPPSFMLDASTSTIWHTQWSTTTTSSHPADQKYPFTLIFTFTKTRAASASGLFNEAALRTPAAPFDPIVVKEISLLHRSASNRVVKDVRVYGIDLQGKEIDFGQFTLSNTVQETKLALNNNEILKAVKIVCLTTFSTTNQFANFNEIYLTGYPEK